MKAEICYRKEQKYNDFPYSSTERHPILKKQFLRILRFLESMNNPDI